MTGKEVTTYSPAPAEDKDGSDASNPRVGEKATDSAGAIVERAAQIIHRDEDNVTLGPPRDWLDLSDDERDRFLGTARRVVQAVADELWAMGEHQAAMILREKAER